MPALGKPAPEIVEFPLALAINLEGDLVVKGELRAAVQRSEFLPGKLEFDGHD